MPARSPWGTPLSIGIGAYASALAALNWHFPFPLAALSAMLVAGGCGMALGLPTLRLKEDYLAIVTLGFGVIMDLVFLNLEITGGPDGLPGIPSPTLFGLSFRSCRPLSADRGRGRGPGPAVTWRLVAPTTAGPCGPSGTMRSPPRSWGSTPRPIKW